MTSAHRELRQRLGNAAEEMAAAYLSLQGWEVTGRNVRIAGGEIDLIARRGGWLLLVEVRYRGSAIHGLPVETVCGRKVRALARTGRAYIARHRREAECWRFDVLTVAIEPDGEARIRSFPGAVPLQ
jgi:putative endonuclease